MKEDERREDEGRRGMREEREKGKRKVKHTICCVNNIYFHRGNHTCPHTCHHTQHTNERVCLRASHRRGMNAGLRSKRQNAGAHDAQRPSCSMTYLFFYSLLLFLFSSILLLFLSSILFLFPSINFSFSSPCV